MFLHIRGPSCVVLGYSTPYGLNGYGRETRWMLLRDECSWASEVRVVSVHWVEEIFGLPRSCMRDKHAFLQKSIFEWFRCCFV